MFYSRLKELIKKKGITKKQFCEDIEINKNLPKYWEDNNTIPTRTILNAISNYFNVSVDYLLGKSDDPTPPYTHTFDLFSIEGITPIGKTKKLPILGNIACGEPVWAEQEFNGYIEVEDGIKADFCLRAKGDSMIGARIFDGDIVFVKRQPTVENGEIAVVLIDNEATLKRVKLYPDKQKLVLHPENPAYEPLVFVGEELNEIKILGKAVAFQSLVR